MPADFPFRAVPLGGLGRIGGNLMVYETAEDLIVVDCGVAFPGPDEPGVDWIVPDVSYLASRAHKLRGYVITHGHEDHIGALPYVLPDLPAPVFGSAFTLALIEQRLAEHGIDAELCEVGDREEIRLGALAVEMIPVAHSIPGAFAIAIDTPVGTVVHTGDFKIDDDPPDGRATDVERFTQLGDHGVAALFSDSTNAEREGRTRGEKEIARVLAPLIAQCSGRVLMTTFSSNVSRLQAAIDAAVAAGRKVVPVGRSVRQMIELCQTRGWLRAHGSLRDVDQLDDIAADEVLVLASGCQAEARSAFGRIAAGTHGKVRLGAGDRAILSARHIPGNEQAIGRALNCLLAAGVEVIDARRVAGIHTSGHAHSDEQRQMITLCRPRHFVPVHGEVCHMQQHGRTAADADVGARVHLLELGQPLELRLEAGEVHARLGTPVTAGDRYFDGDETVGEVVLRDRALLAEVGFVACTALIDHGGRPVAPPKITTRGVIYVDECAGMLDRAADDVEAALEALELTAGEEQRLAAMRLALRRFFRKELGRRPMILPSLVISD